MSPSNKILKSIINEIASHAVTGRWEEHMTATRSRCLNEGAFNDQVVNDINEGIFDMFKKTKESPPAQPQAEKMANTAAPFTKDEFSRIVYAYTAKVSDKTPKAIGTTLRRGVDGMRPDQIILVWSHKIGLSKANFKTKLSMFMSVLDSSDVDDVKKGQALLNLLNQTKNSIKSDTSASNELAAAFDFIATPKYSNLNEEPKALCYHIRSAHLGGVIDDAQFEDLRDKLILHYGEDNINTGMGIADAALEDEDVEAGAKPKSKAPPAEKKKPTPASSTPPESPQSKADAAYNQLLAIPGANIENLSPDGQKRLKNLIGSLLSTVA